MRPSKLASLSARILSCVLIAESDLLLPVSEAFELLAHGVGRHLLVTSDAADVQSCQIDLALWDPTTLVVLRGLGLLGMCRTVGVAVGEAVATGFGHVH